MTSLARKSRRAWAHLLDNAAQVSLSDEMMNTRLLIALAFLILGYGTVYSSSFFLRQSKKLTGKELGEIHPVLAWVGRGFLFYNIFSVFAWLLCYGVFIYHFQSKAGIIIFVGTFFTGIAVADGVFAIFTGVHPVPIRRNYFFVYEDKARRVGWLQIALGLVEIATAVFLTFAPVSAW